MVTPSATTSAQAYPHTARSLRESLGLSEQELQHYMDALALPLRTDPLTGALVFSHNEADLIGQTHRLLQRQNAGELTCADTPAEATSLEGATKAPPLGATLPQRLTVPEQLQPLPSTKNGTTLPVAELALLVETVSASRGEIINAVTQLIDDRLAGLDEVIVELIRCKTENESLRQKLGTVLRDKEQLQDELNRFKPVQFGFYKKLGS
jgi:hypothetical protein